jgi:hypothetical protein
MATEFKSFADFKRRVKRMTLVKQGWYKDGVLKEVDSNWLIGIDREVEKINSVDIMLKTQKPDGEWVTSHLQIGKASDWAFDGDVATKDDGHGVMQYRVEA